MSIFPILGDSAQASSEAWPLYRDILCDNTGMPVFQDGVPVFVSGTEALKIWAVTALRTVRYQHAVYSNQFGCELQTLVGQQYSDDLKTAEAPRMVREALLTNPYIQDVTDISVEFTGTVLMVSAKIQSIYGEVTLFDQQEL